LPQAHEELVVTAVVVPELEEPDDVPEVEAPGVEELDVEPELDDLPAVEATFAAFARAGSLPVTSWTRIPPELARNVAVATATTRVRITLIRRLRARSRSATTRFAPDPPAERGPGRSAPAGNTARFGESRGVIITSISMGRNAMHTDSPLLLATP
jgi:hypothetical protein